LTVGSIPVYASITAALCNQLQWAATVANMSDGDTVADRTSTIVLRRPALFPVASFVVDCDVAVAAF